MFSNEDNKSPFYIIRPFSLVLEYIWVGGDNELRSKTRVIHNWNNGSPTNDTIHLIPHWNYDGSSTNQADSNKNTEVKIKPCFVCHDPLNKNDLNIKYFLVLCDTYDIEDKPLETNTRFHANELFKIDSHNEPWYGLEQEYFIFSKNYSNILHDNVTNRFYCGTNNSSLERKIVSEHLDACIRAGLKISGINAEVSPSQWEFQIGPVEGISAGDQMLVSRFLLERIGEKYDAIILYDPKPFQHINGSGCHTNFSTASTRENYETIIEYITKLSANHSLHISLYGKDNNKRLTGKHETSSMDLFTWGVGTRNTSVRIPNDVFADKKGYFEDRRPAANMDPYVVTSLIYKTCCL
jgi:glutamine synthetase